MRRLPRGPLPGLLLAAGLLRILYLLDFHAHSLFWRVMLLDGAVYDGWARRIAAGDIMGGGDIYPLPPLYPYLVAAVYALAGAQPPFIFLLQTFLGLINLALLYLLAERIYGARAALFTGLLALTYGPLMFFETKLLNATLTVSLTLVLLHLCLRAARHGDALSWLAAGAALGVLALVRPEMLLLAPVLAAWAWRDGTVPIKSTPRTLAALTAGVLLVLAPVAVRNILVEGPWSPGLMISSQGSLTFYQSNNERAAGLYVSLAPEGFSGDPEKQAAETHALAQERVGHALSQGAANRYWLGEALGWILQNPADYLLLEGKKLLRFFGSYEYSTEYIHAVERQSVRSLWLAPLPFGLIAALGLMGSLGAASSPAERARRHASLLLILLAATNLATCLVFYVSSRYRLPAAVAFLVLAGGFLARLGRERRPWLQAGVALLLAVILQFPLDGRHLVQETYLHTNTGTLHYDRGEYENALAAYRRAVALRPDHGRGHLGVGVSCEALGRPQEAVRAYEQALRLDRSLDAARAGLQRLRPGSRKPRPAR